MRKIMPVARRVLGESNELTLKMTVSLRDAALYFDTDASLDGLREAVTTLEETMQRNARRVLGGAHPLSQKIEEGLRTRGRARFARQGAVSAIRAALDATEAT